MQFAAKSGARTGPQLVPCITSRVEGWYRRESPAQEIAVLSQHQDVNAGARQHIPQHHSGRAGACDAAAHGKFSQAPWFKFNERSLAYQKRWVRELAETGSCRL